MISFIAEGALILHILAVVIAMGAALVADTMFFSFLKDYKISRKEVSVLNILSRSVWTGLWIIVVSGIVIFFTDSELYGSNPKFLSKMFIVAVIIINGFILNKYISPYLTRIEFDTVKPHPRIIIRRRLAFALGAVSVVSWFSAFIVAMIKTSSISFLGYIMTYLAFVCCAVIFSQVVERVIAKKKIHW